MKPNKPGVFKWKLLLPQPLNRKGFTLIEAVTALFVFTICFSLFSIAVKQLQEVTQAQQSDRQLEWHLFLNQFETDIQHFKLDNVTSSKATFIQLVNGVESPEKVTYSRELQRLLRQVGGKGYQPMLMKLRTLTFQLKGTFLVIQAEFINGEKYQSSVSLAQQMKERVNE